MNFSNSGQLGFDLGDSKRSSDVRVDPEEVRAELEAILAEAKGATDGCPWDERTFNYHKVVVPQMSNWLPAAEAAKMRFDFQQEVERIEALIAA